MARPLEPAERENFLAEPHVAVLSVASDDERPPLTAPVWYAYQPGGNITFFTGTEGRRVRKTRLLERAGKFSLCVQKTQFPYKYVTVECTLVDVERRPKFADVVAIVGRYLPEDAANGLAEAETANPTDTFALFTARPDRWLSVDFRED